MAENILKYDNATHTSSKGTAILGRLTGPCADIIHSTRNGRKYSQKLWEKVFADPIVKEYFECGGVFGELNHPADREETDLTKVCICMPEPPKKDSNGTLIGSWDILDTPNGRILKCLCDYGYKIGISSRGSGDTYIDSDGDEAVDPETYNFQGFDIVYLPAVKNARLQYEGLTESISQKPNFRTALQEQFKRSNDDERKVMAETLKYLNIDYFPTKGDNKIHSTNKLNEAANSGSDMIVEWQKSLRENKGLRKEIAALKEQLSVCYAKEAEYEQDIEGYKRSISKLSESVKQNSALKEKNKSLNEKLTMHEENVGKVHTDLCRQLKNEESTNQSLNEQLHKEKEEKSILMEENESLKEAVKRHRDKVSSLQEDYAKCREKLAEAEKENRLNENAYTQKIEQNKKLIEQYRTIAKRSVEKYIDEKASMLGISSYDITNRLSENYSFEEIDKVCESLQQYALNVSALPFTTLTKSKKSSMKMRLNESKEMQTINSSSQSPYDDTIDESLIALAGLN